MLTIQTLISTMHQTDHSLLDKMNIQTDAIVVNQCDRDEIERFTYKGHQILWMSLRERGASLSRNTALMRATADILVMADDPHRKEFEQIAKTENINVILLGQLPYAQVCAQLKQCDVVINPIAHGSAISITNKHGDYAACGRPVLNTQESAEYRALVEQYKMGLNCNNADPVDLAAKLKYLLNNPALREEMGKNAPKSIDEKFNRKHTYVEIFQCVAP